MSEAKRIFARLLPGVPTATEFGIVHAIEDVQHPDYPRKYFRIEYRSTLDGKHASAWCHYAPGEGRPARNMDLHVMARGHLCLGHGATTVVRESPFGLEWTIARTRYWCIAYAYCRQTGKPFPNP